MKSHIFGVVIVSLCLLALSCAEEITERERVVYPDIALKNTKYLLGRSDGDNVLFNAESMQIFLNRKEAIIEGASFEQRKTDTSDLFVSGSADKARINTETYLSSLEGDVKIYLHEDGNSIEADSIKWDKDTERVESIGNVYLDYGDIKVRGINLTGNLQTGVFTFKEITEGLITAKAVEEISTPQNTGEDANIDTNGNAPMNTSDDTGRNINTSSSFDGGQTDGDNV